MVALQYYSHRLCIQQGNPVQVYVGYGVLVVLFEFYIKSTLLRGIQIQMAQKVVLLSSIYKSHVLLY